MDSVSEGSSATTEYIPYSVQRIWLNTCPLKLENETYTYSLVFGDFMCSLEICEENQFDLGQMYFKPSHRELTKLEGNWLIEGVITFYDNDGEVTMLESTFSCDLSNDSHSFDSQLIHGQQGVVDVRFTRLRGVGVTPRPNYSVPSETADVCLIVDGHKLYLSKTVLAHFSDHFRELFFGDSADRNLVEVEVEGVYGENFVNLLDLCHGSLLFDCRYAEFLFELTDRFGMHAATRKLEMFLVNLDWRLVWRRKIPMLLLADKFKLNFLMARAVQNLTRQNISKLLLSEDKRSLSVAALNSVMNRMWSIE